MKALTISGLPNEVYEDLQRRARLNRRSLNDEVIAVLSAAGAVHGDTNSEAVRKRLRAERLIAEANRLRIGMPRFLTAAEIDAAIAEGRHW